jgi:hypothetical protein
MKPNLNLHSDPGMQSSSALNIFSLCRKAAAQIEKAKAMVVSEFRGRLEEHAHLLRLAVNEAEALAWQTEYPHLLFPTLAVEKAQAVEKWHQRQWFLRRTNRWPARAA